MSATVTEFAGALQLRELQKALATEQQARRVAEDQAAESGRLRRVAERKLTRQEAAIEKYKVIRKEKRREEKRMARRQQVALDQYHGYAKQVEVAREAVANTLAAEYGQRDAARLRLQQCYRRLIHSETKRAAYIVESQDCPCKDCTCFTTTARRMADARGQLVEPFEHERADTNRCCLDTLEGRPFQVPSLASESCKEALGRLMIAMDHPRSWERSTLPRNFVAPLVRAQAYVDGTLPSVTWNQEAWEDQGASTRSSTPARSTTSRSTNSRSTSPAREVPDRTYWQDL